MFHLLKGSIIQQTPLMHVVELTDKNLSHTKILQIHLFMCKLKVLGGKNLNDLLLFDFTDNSHSRKIRTRRATKRIVLKHPLTELGKMSTVSI